MKRDDWPVKDHGIRPAGHPNHCFYCQEPTGGEHDPDCVIRSRTVVVRVAIEYVLGIPEHWSAEGFVYHRNHGSWCGSNVLQELDSLADGVKCLCGFAKFEYLREATETDEEKSQVFVKDLPT